MAMASNKIIVSYFMYGQNGVSYFCNYDLNIFALVP